MQEGRVIMDKISPRMMRALQKTGEHISGYINRKDMIAFQNAPSDSYIKQEKSISVTPVYYIRLDDGRYIGIISKCPIIAAGLSVLFLLGMVFSFN